MNLYRLTETSEIIRLVEFHNQNSKFVVLDTETTSKDPRQAQLLDVQISGYQKDEAVVFDAKEAPLLTNLSKRLILVAHNYRYDAHVLYRHKVDLLTHTWEDTLLLGHLLDENRETYALDSYIKEYWGEDGHDKEAFWKKYQSYAEASEEEKVNYATRDVVYTGRLHGRLKGLLAASAIPDSLIRHVHRLQASLLQTEIEGIRVDIPYLTELGVKLRARIAELKPKMRGLVEDAAQLVELQLWDKAMSRYKTDKGRAGTKRPEFSFESPKQLQTLLYGVLELPAQKSSKTRQVSTDYESLQKIRDYHPVIELIQENRELQKVYTSYIGGTLDRISQARIYPSFRVNGTVTGRLAHYDPNLGQLPKTGGVRGMYVPDPGWVLVSADYSQLEVILEANLTADKNLIHMLENGESKHDLTARELRCDRDTAKSLNFSLQYWCSPYQVAKLLGISVPEGKQVWDKYWSIYSGPKRLKDQTDKEVDAGTPLVSMIYGRRRRFPVMQRPEWSGDYRQAYNFKIQSPGADLTSEAFYLTDAELKHRGWGKCLWTVHDEVIASVKGEYGEEARDLLVLTMESLSTKYGLRVPLKAQGSGPSLRWEDK